MGNSGADWQGFLYIAFFQLLFHIPTIAVYIIGIVVSIIKYKNYPRVGLLSGIGFAVLLMLSFISVLITASPTFLSSRGYSIQSIGYILSTIGVVTTIIAAAASALLLGAVWKDRT